MRFPNNRFRVRVTLRARDARRFFGRDRTRKDRPHDPQACADAAVPISMPATSKTPSPMTTSRSTQIHDRRSRLTLLADRSGICTDSR